MLRRILPKSLYARTVLIVILPIFLMQSVITYVFFARHWDSVTANLSRSAAGQIALFADLWEATDDPTRHAVLIESARRRLDMSVRHDPDRRVARENALASFNLYNRVFEARLADRVGRPYWLNTADWPDYVEVRVAVDDGQLIFFVPKTRVFAVSGPIFLAWLVGTSVLLGWIAIVFLRNQVRSILRLADAAEAFGRGRDDPEFRPTGATEVRRAGRAFIAMRERLRRFVDQRTTMLAAVSHDLRTPLTRMKLTLSMSPQADDIAALREDVAAMERMVAAYLDFAADVALAEPPEGLDLGALVGGVVARLGDADRARVAMSAQGDLRFEGRRSVVERAVANLIDNALKYASHVWVEAFADDPFLVLTVDDDGPGIPQDRRDEAFRPFARLDEARSSAIPGVGLGLAVVRDAARAHGGEIVFSDAPQGGLRATLRLPR